MSLAEQSVDPTLYTSNEICTGPMLLFGEKIKHALDHARINIKSQFEPTRIRVGDNFFYGVTLEPNRKFKEVVNKITSVPMQHENVVEMYKKRLELYNLSCDNCWAHLSENVFPLDVETIPEISINSPYMNSHNMFEQDESMPWFTQHMQPKLFIITNR